MNTNKLLTSKGETIVVYSTATRYVWRTDWIRAHGVGAADFAMNVRNVVGSGQAKPCYQTAAVLTDYPDAPAVISTGSYVAAAGWTHYRETLSLTTKAWVRFGVASSNSAGTALGSVEADLVVSVLNRAYEVGALVIDVRPGQISGTDINYFVLGDWSPTLGIDTMMAAVVVLDNDSTYSENGLFCRTAIDPMQPNAWQGVEAAWNNPASGSSVRNTTALSLPAGANAATNLLVQFALGVRKKSGAAGNPRCQIIARVSRSNA
jgi:hypothetical protein